MYTKTVLRSRIYRIPVTAKQLTCPGSIGLAPSLMQEAGLSTYEQVHVLNINNGARFTTYVFPVDGMIAIGAEVYGAAAREVELWDPLIILAYVDIPLLDNIMPKLIDWNNWVEPKEFVWKKD